jgi:hypothetical protein
MSFSSVEWTIPELCVWIVTGSRAALNGLSPSARQSLKRSDRVHSGAYAARDDVIEAAQNGKVIITGVGVIDAFSSKPERVTLPLTFWHNAELEDATHYEAPGLSWCVARWIDQTNTAKEFRDLLVDSAKAKELWSQAPRSSDAGVSSAAPEDMQSIPPRRSNKISADDDMVEILHKERIALGDDGVFSLRAAIKAHINEIEGNSEESIIRRLTRKYTERFPG